MTNEPVPIYVTLANTVDANTVKSRLEQLANDVHISVVNFKRLKMGALEGTTSQATYQALFGGELEYKHGQWYERKPAKIPTQFQGEIVDIKVVRETKIV